jgi:rhamnogalacturonyl hydrolase YesR
LEPTLENYVKVKIAQNKISRDDKYDFKKTAKRLSDELIASYEENSGDSWKWFEDKITYDIGRFPWAIFRAYSAFGDSKYLDVARQSLDFLLEQIYDKKLDCFSFPGYRGWFEKNGSKALFGQQPIEAGSVVEACTEAFTATKEKKYLDWAKKALDWYHGKNILGAEMIDKNTGGVYDGLEKDGVNLNQGAEALLSYLLARLSFADTNSH